MEIDQNGQDNETALDHAYAEGRGEATDEFREQLTTSNATIEDLRKRVAELEEIVEHHESTIIRDTNRIANLQARIDQLEPLEDAAIEWLNTHCAIFAMLEVFDSPEDSEHVKQAREDHVRNRGELIAIARHAAERREKNQKGESSEF